MLVAEKIYLALDYRIEAVVKILPDELETNSEGSLQWKIW